MHQSSLCHRTLFFILGPQRTCHTAAFLRHLSARAPLSLHSVSNGLPTFSSFCPQLLLFLLRLLRACPPQEKLFIIHHNNDYYYYYCYSYHREKLEETTRASSGSERETVHDRAS